MNILITGATGFVGKQLIKKLTDKNHTVSVAVRSRNQQLDDSIPQFNLGELSNKQNWSSALTDIDVVIHLAARVHIMDETTADPLNAFRTANTEATLNLAHQSEKNGVKRFVFISTIKVNGESTDGRAPFEADELCKPQDPYAISKYEAEQGLMQIAQQSNMEVVIIRPPLIYGPGVKGNFANMIKWLDINIPLPFGAVNNQRSLLALDNLISFILLCSEHSQAANQIFVIADGEDVSTKDLLNKTATAMHKKAWLLPVPISWMEVGAKLIGKEMLAVRLFGSLQVDISKACKVLGWKPVVTMDQQLAKMITEEFDEEII